MLSGAICAVGKAEVCGTNGNFRVGQEPRPVRQSRKHLHVDFSSLFVKVLR